MVAHDYGWWEFITDISSVPKFKVVGSTWILAIFVYEKHTELFTYGNLECIK